MIGKITLASKPKGFTQIPNSILRSKTLSWKAKGLMSYLLSLDEDWVIYKSDLKNRASDGYDSMCSAFKELEDAGYITSKTVRIDGGLFGGVEYFVHENPCFDGTEPIRDYPQSVKPDTDNPQLMNNSLINKREKLFKKDFETRVREFKQSLYPFVLSETNPDGYDKDLVKDFFDYWAEKSLKRDVMRWELQDAFEVSRRLITWKRNQKNTKPATSHLNQQASN